MSSDDTITLPDHEELVWDGPDSISEAGEQEYESSDSEDYLTLMYYEHEGRAGWRIGTEDYWDPRGHIWLDENDKIVFAGFLQLDGSLLLEAGQTFVPSDILRDCLFT